jgi:hypothetical protein
MRTTWAWALGGLALAAAVVPRAAPPDASPGGAASAAARHVAPTPATPPPSVRPIDTQGVATDRPGDPTPARIWIENRGPDQAVPVVLHDVATTAPLAVRIVSPLEPGATLRARLVAQPWEYSTVRVAAGQDLAEAIADAGGEGWEATGVHVTDASGTTVLLKRPAPST